MLLAQTWFCLVIAKDGGKVQLVLTDILTRRAVLRVWCGVRPTGVRREVERSVEYPRKEKTLMI